MNVYGNLRRCTERDAKTVDSYPYLRRRVRHYPAADPAWPHALPLGHQADYQTPQVTPMAERS